MVVRVHAAPRRVGILLLLASGAFAQAPRNPQEPRNLLGNGGFENPPVAAGSTAALESAGGWGATAGSLQLANAAGTRRASEGEQQLELADLAVVRQTCRTRPGQNYALSLAFSPRAEAGPVAFEVWYAGSLLETIDVPAGSSPLWQPKSWLVVGAGSQDVVELRALTSGAGVGIDDSRLTPFDPAVTGQRLRNGAFEDDPRIDADTSMANPVYVGWFSRQLQTVEVKDLGASGNGFSGKQVVDLDESLGIAQRVFVVPDKAYQLRIAWSPNPLDDRDRSFTVSFGGKLVDTVAVARGASIVWSTKTYSVASESPLTTVELQDLGGGFNGALLDGISLTGPVPEPETDGQIASYKIVASTPLAGMRLGTDAMFARGITSLGDLDGDGIQDLAVGSVGDDDGAFNAGAVWIVFLNRDKTVKGTAKISELRGGLVADFLDEDGFGRALGGIGDLDGDGVPDMVVGANERDVGGNTNSGSAYVLFLNRNGTVKGQHEINAQSGDALQFVPRRSSEFGSSIAGMGDVDGDGIPDVAIGARFSNSVQVCFLRRDGTVRGSKNITYGVSGFGATPSSFFDLLGMSIANMGDFDGDGVNDLLIGAYGREFAGQDFTGGQFLLLLNRDGTCRRWLYYGAENMNPRSQNLGLHYDLGTACAGPGDIDGDGVRDMVVGAQREGAVWGFDREQGSKNGAVYVLLLNANGTIKTCQRLGDRAGGWDYHVEDGARWGESLAALGDHDGNGLVDIAVGSRFVFHTGGAFLIDLSNGAQALSADFMGAPVTGAAPLAVSFTDLSSGPVVARTWDFGDGTGSTEVNPSHAYSAPGTYTVALTVVDADGLSQTRTRAGFVSVTSGDALPTGVTRLGCGVNPPSSFRILAGTPRVGMSMTFGVDNPLGTQAVGSTPSVVVSWNGTPNRPCGTLVIGLGMSAPGANGERLVATPTLAVRSGSPWQGPGLPAPVAFKIPTGASLVGRTLYVQGRMLDASTGAAIPLALADGFAMVLQP